ncbi:cupredoxin domain-containing protein [Aliagarivorans taiwanensis]|uniref:cupredoxin domain-containing protein n=1 Tax=Aliagarivorans taiwanensis TaxID=561966 RepID=UPI000407E7F1|nr:hypothetical protein [Aliagarivorans taiwanensis]
MTKGKTRRRCALLAMLIAASPLAWASESQVRSVSVTMLDSMRFQFEPALSELKPGELVEFVVTNQGQIVHEFVLGSPTEQAEHREQMRNSGYHHHHHSSNAVTLEAGQRATLAWQMPHRGQLEVACNIPGHYEAGMFEVWGPFEND